MLNRDMLPNVSLILLKLSFQGYTVLLSIHASF